MRRLLVASLFLFGSVLAACAPLGGSALPVQTATAAPLPYDEYRRLAARDGPVLRIDTARSLVVMEVGRAGSLAGLGHDHIVASRSVEGFVAPRAGRADVVVPLAALEVDEPSLRQAAGMQTQPTAADIEGTRRNMLGPVLEAERYPYASIAVRNVAAVAGKGPLPVTVTLHGVTRTMDVAAQVDTRDGVVTVSGEFPLAQSDFGIAPFSLLGGAIAVRDRVDIRFRLVAVPLEPG